MRWKTFGLLGLMLLLAACSKGLPATLADATPTQTASPLPTAVAEPQQSGMQVVMFYSPL